jgi:predicted porin
MKKTQVALAALALVASTAALAEVKISGILDFGVGQTTGHGNYMEQGAWSDHSSLTISGSEDLGGGMKSFFVLDQGFNQQGKADNGGNGTLFSRQTLVGLSGEFGSVSAGQQLSPYILSYAMSQPGTPGNFWVNRIIMGGGLSAAACSSQACGSSTFQSGGFFIANSVMYTTPSIAGWTGTVMTNTANGANGGAIADGTDNDKYTAYAINGSLGGAGVNAGYQKRKNTYSSWVVGATYPMGDLTLGANFAKHKDEGADEVGSYMIAASYALNGSTSLTGGFAANDLAKDQSMTNLGIKHNLSKSTFVYTTYVRATNGAIPAIADRGMYATTGSSKNNTVVGVSHSF